MLRLFFVFCSLGALVGCGGGVDDAPELVVVTGKVTLDGSPVTSGSVEFFPDSDNGTEGPSSYAEIGSDGTYKLIGSGNQEGAIVGHHKVIVTCPEMSSSESGSETAPGECKVPAIYGDPDSTPLSREVKSGDANDIPLELKSN